MRRVSILILLLAISACVPKRDPVTIQDLAALAVSREGCAASIARHEATGVDRKSLRNIREVCECFEDAGGSSIRAQACETLRKSAVAYEEAKP